MVRVLHDDVVERHVSNIVHLEDCARNNLALEADVHLHRIGANVVGRKRRIAGQVDAFRQSVGEISAVGGRPGCFSSLLVRGFQRRYARGDPGSANGLSADSRGDVCAIDCRERGAVGESQPAGANSRRAEKQPGRKAGGTIK